MRITPVNNTSFTANPLKLVPDSVSNAVADGVRNTYKAAFDRPWLEKLSGFLSRHPKLDGKNLATHMMVGGSLITTTTGVMRTLNNEKLDKDRRQTLAINQTLVTIASTIGNYSINGALDKWWTKQTDKFKVAQIQAGLSANLDAKVKGMGFFKSAMIFGLVYRYVAPVIVTPIANKIGDKVIENKKAKEAALNKTA